MWNMVFSRNMTFHRVLLGPLLMSENEEDMPELSAETLAALQSFYREQAEQQMALNAVAHSGQSTDITLQEDWQLSQFWYTEQTAERLAQEALDIAGEHGRIACISAPTAFKKIREIKPETVTVKCLEYDRRFEIFGNDYEFYDYKEPLNLSCDWKQSFDIVIADPPFLSEECLCKTAITAKFLSKDKIILCTGAVMEELALTHLNARPCNYIPKHTNQLQNEFRCYTNYESVGLNRTVTHLATK